MGLASEKLQPQIAKSNLTQQALNNYNATRVYYSERRLMFNRVLEQNRTNALAFEKDINNVIEQQWNKEIFSILKGIYFGNKNSVENRVEAVQKRFETSPYLDGFLDAVKQNNPRVFFSKLGFIFENFIHDNGIKPFIDSATSFGGQVADSLLASFVSGTQQSLASAVSGKKSIRPDILVHLTNISFTDKDDVYMSNKNLPVELQGNLSIDWSNAVPTTKEILENDEILTLFLQDGNFFGFSAKLWSNSQGKPFMNSSIMAKMLNAVFHETDSKNRRHGWEIDYASEYTAYLLSKNLFHIIGPTNIAMVTSGGIIWMDQFLASHIFYMRIQIEKNLKGGRIFPGIVDNAIYVRKYDNNKEILKMKSQRHRSKKYGNYIDLKLEMH